MRYRWILICLVVAGNAVYAQSVLTHSQQPAKDAYMRSDAYVFQPDADSLVAFFKANSFYKRLPRTFNNDSLFNRDFKPLYPIRMMTFIPDSMYDEYEPSTFTPFCYEFDKEAGLHGFYVHFESIPSSNSYHGVFLFICNTEFVCLDYFPICEVWIFSGSASNSTRYNRFRNYDFSITEESYDIDYEENGPVNYRQKVSYTLIFDKGKHVKTHLTEKSWTEKVTFKE